MSAADRFRVSAHHVLGVAGAPPRWRSRLGPLFALTVAVVVVVGLDWATKAWAEQTLAPREPVPIVGDFFRLSLGYNSGSAFGLFAQGGVLLLLLTGVIILVLVIWMGRALRSGAYPTSAIWPVGLLLGGALANFVDRLPDSRVTDFLDFGLGSARWPTFNLADTFITLGAAGLLLVIVLRDRRVEPVQQPGVVEKPLDGG